MLEMILVVITTLLKAIFFFFVVPWIFYYRVYDYFLSRNHYSKQKLVWEIPGVWGSYPIIGNLLSVIKAKAHQI